MISRLARPVPPQVLSWVFIAILAILLADVIVCGCSIRRFSNDIDFAESYDNFREQISGTLALVRDAETEQRGYLLTGDVRFLDRYQATLRPLEEQLRTLAKQTVDHFEPYRGQLARYGELVREKIGILIGTIEARRQGQPFGPDALVRDRETMDQLRSVATDLMTGARVLLGERNQEALSNLHWTYGSAAAGVILNVVLLAALWWAMRWERRARVEAERANQLKDEFLATLSHELRTPIHAVLGWTALMADERFEDVQEIRRGLRIIEQNAETQAELVEELLDLSRIVAGRFRLETEPIDLVPVIRAAIETVQVAAARKRIRIDPSLASDAGLVMGDPRRMQQIVWNLLSNAVKFTPEGGGIEVALRGFPAGVELSVRDNGIGIGPELLPHIFERFRQGDSSTTRKHGGLGIGLALVKSLVELQGGHIEARSAGDGHGATFTVRFPVSGPPKTPVRLAPLHQAQTES